mmetsp:Transcript_2176/g.3376  ORF Transcript_2176/g.3376 Transcript_2176/m.3376 type:complete len:498 (-) Transcript_2176:74-1567(-)
MMELPEETIEALTKAGGTLVKPGESMDMEQLRALQHSQQPSAQDISQGMRQGWEAMKEMRADADVAKRMEIVETCKADANREVGSGSAGKALKSYLVAVWLLMRGDPEPTRALVAPVAVERDALLALGAGSDDLTDDAVFGESYAKQVQELRTALHTNVAAAALKLNMWVLAGDACKVVLREQPEHPKALFRLAKAGEGSGDLSAAIATLGKLLKVEGQGDNLEARKLLQALRNRKSKEAKIYGGFFDRVREEGGSMYDDREAEVQKVPQKAADLKNLPGEQDASVVEDIIKQRMSCLPENVQLELKRMKKVGIAPTEIVKAYRRFLKEELKLLRQESDEEESVLIDNVMQATERKMEFVINKVRAQIAARKTLPPINQTQNETLPNTPGLQTQQMAEDAPKTKGDEAPPQSAYQQPVEKIQECREVLQKTNKEWRGEAPRQDAQKPAEKVQVFTKDSQAIAAAPVTVEACIEAKGFVKEDTGCFRWLAQKIACCRT